MAVDDFRPYEGADVGIVTSGYPLSAPVAASETFLRGEPVSWNGSGAVAEPTTDPAAVAGIAMEQALEYNGSTSLAAGTKVRVRALGHGLWVTSNFATDGAGTSATPSVANAEGQLAGFTTTGGSWYVDTGAANPLVRIEKVLDSNGFNISDPDASGTGASVVFREA